MSPFYMGGKPATLLDQGAHMPKQAAQYWKAILGFIVPGVVTLGSAITDGSDGGSHITSTEWLTAAFACVLTAGAVYTKANTPAEPGA